MPTKSNQALSQIRVPPHSYEAEESVLGSLIIDKDAMIRVADVLAPPDFYRESHRQIYQAMMDLYQKSDPIDVLSLSQRLKEKKQLKLVGGESGLAHLATVVPTSGNVAHYGRIVKKTATLRRLISTAADISELGFEEQEELDEVLDKAEQALFGVSQDIKQYSFTKIADTLEEAFVRIDKLHKGDESLRGVPTGFPSLDHKLAGWQKSDLVIVAARPSVGKTSLALDFARQAALAGTAVGFFSLEMSKEQVVDRLLAAHAHVDLWRLRTGKLDTRGEYDDFSRIGEAMGELSNAPIYVDDHTSNNVMGMRTMARRLQAEHGLGLIIIDYLQLMESSKYSDNRVQEVSDISRNLKRLAIELKVPVIALSQLSRAIEMRSGKPKLSDLRESGCLAGDTLITRADTGERIKIRELAQRNKQEAIPVFAIDDQYKLVTKPMTKVFSSGLKRVYTLTTRSGREIQASANHPFRTIQGWQALEDLQAGAHVALPRELHSTTKKSQLNEDELILLAHLIGDGCTVPRQPIHYTSADNTNITAVERTATKLFKITPRRVRQQNWWHVYLPSPYHLTHGRRNPISLWLTDLGLGLKHSWEKYVPSAVFQADNKRIALFLHHLWATDGNISRKKLSGRKPTAAIYYASTSKPLAHDVQHLLLRLGIQSTVRTTLNKRHRDIYQVHVQGKDMQLQFLKTVNSAGEKGALKKELIEALETITSNVNTDVIPKETWRGVITQEKEKADMSWRNVSVGINMAFSGSSLFKSGLSRERMNRVATAIKSQPLKDLAESGVYWDTILSIEPQGVEEVFDATVPDVHNFVANDIVVHNSIEQDADIVMFIHREDIENEEDGSRPDSYDVSLLIEKHRNGPTGEIPLRFNSKHASFAESTDIYEAEPTAQVHAPASA